jgi:4-amino-4-deoxy-L-arabinose transferase-like glycosyltransferase
MAASWGLLADEAYYWVWSDRPALGYYDQPPGVAWLITLCTAVLGDSEWAIRAPFIGCGLVGAALQGWATGRPVFAAVWWACIPPIAWLSLFATSDALLLVGWAACVACAIKGRAWWLGAAVGAAVASYGKLSGLGVLPLALLAGSRRVEDRGWRVGGLALYLLLMLPLLAWNSTHDFVNFRFQLGEGLFHPHPPGLLGAVYQQLEQTGAVTPLAYLAILGWLASSTRAVFQRGAEVAEAIPWATCAPIMLFFLVCSPFAPAEAHWPAVAYVSAGFGLSAVTGRLQRLRDVGLGMALGCTIILATHGFAPWLPLFNDPGIRLTRGPVMAAMVAQWAAPEGTTIGGPHDEATPLIYTERYQEAALIQYYTGLTAFKHHLCGRTDQYNSWDLPVAEHALFVRPATTGYATCLDPLFSKRSGPNRIQGIDHVQRLVGRWDIFEFETLR